MSLLMDALKKAEEAKRNAAPATGAPGELSLEPVSPQPGSQGQSPLPNLDDHLATVDADLAAVAASPAPSPAAPPPQSSHQPAPPPTPSVAPAAAADMEAERQAARNLFNAKLAAGNGTPPNRNKLWLALGALAVGLLGIGIYFWFQLQGLSQNPMIARPAPTPAQPQPLPPAPMATPIAMAPTPVAAIEAPPSPPVPEMPTPLTRERPVPQERQPALPPEEPSPIRLSRGKPATNPLLERAYGALQREDFAAAVQDYDKVLQADPRNTDALLGMASIAGREGQTAKAEALYLKALEADPKNPVALAGLVSLLGNGDPAAAESRLKNLLATQPEAGHAHFALGNVYARQGRWSEAQQAYFKSLASDGDNPDYLFNLAVSLDHLRQVKPAQQYYQAALGAAAGRSAMFDKEGARRRLQELAAP
ncbi:MAG: tetratricopeptide repeat protein [Pseudomonadota bacterium]